MTRQKYLLRKRHDYAGVNDGEFTPALKDFYWTLSMDTKTGATILVHAKTFEELPCSQ